MTAALPMGGQKITGMADPTNPQDAGTKAYIDALVATFFSTGDGKLTLKSAPDTGWIMCDDGTFGSGSSGSSNRANADTQPLFNLLYNLADAWAPILTSGGGATTRAAQGSASAAWAANCRMTLPRQLGRAIVVAGAGAGLTSRPLGSNFGEESHLLTSTELPGHTHSGTTGAMNSNASHSHSSDAIRNLGPGGGAGNWGSGGFEVGHNATINAANIDHSHNFTTDGGAVGNAVHNNTQASAAWNIMVKL